MRWLGGWVAASESPACFAVGCLDAQARVRCKVWLGSCSHCIGGDCMGYRPLSSSVSSTDGRRPDRPREMDLGSMKRTLSTCGCVLRFLK